MSYMFWVWLGVTVAAVIFELSTNDLSSIWFAVGGFVAMLMSISPKVPWWASLIVFLLLSLALLVSLRNLAKKFLSRKSEGNTNLDLIIGKEAHITEPGNFDMLATVKINGLNWSAKTAKGDILEVGERVVIREIQGNKLIVEKINEAEEVKEG